MVGPEQLHRPMGTIAVAPDSKFWAAGSFEHQAADKAHSHDAAQAHVDFMGSLMKLLQAVQAATTPTAFDLQGRTLELTVCFVVLVLLVPDSPFAVCQRC